MVEDCAALLESVPDVETLFERKTTDEIQSLLDEYLSSDSSSEASSSETHKYNTSTTSKVDKAYKELMND